MLPVDLHRLWSLLQLLSWAWEYTTGFSLSASIHICFNDPEGLGWKDSCKAKAVFAPKKLQMAPVSYLHDMYFISNNTHEKITRFWLGESSAVQVWHLRKKCNTDAKSVTPVQITHRNSGLWFEERHWESCRPMISCKRQWPKFCTETLKKFFSNAKKKASTTYTKTILLLKRLVQFQLFEKLTRAN